MAKTDKKYFEIRNKVWNKRNVVGIGYGKKFRDGIQTVEDCIQIYVRRKSPMCFLNRKDRIPKKINGIKTDVIEIGEIKALDLEYRKKKHRPAKSGISVGHPFVTAGTIGATIEKNGKIYILSNNHVLANSNNGRIGDITVQPGVYDGGNLKDDVIGYLADFEPINFENNNGNKGWVCSLLKTLSEYFGCSECKVIGSKCKKMQNTSLNIMDAAISQVNKKDVDTEIYELGHINGIAETRVGELLFKSGRTTGVTRSNVISINATVKVNYGGKGTAVFEDQIMTGNMSAGGDSGSLIVNSLNEAVSLLFAGSETVTISSPIKPIIERFGFNFITHQKKQSYLIFRRK